MPWTVDTKTSVSILIPFSPCSDDNSKFGISLVSSPSDDGYQNKQSVNLPFGDTDINDKK